MISMQSEDGVYALPFPLYTRPEEFYECDAPQKVLNPPLNGSDTGCTSVSGKERATVP